MAGVSWAEARVAEARVNDSAINNNVPTDTIFTNTSITNFRTLSYLRARAGAVPDKIGQEHDRRVLDSQRNGARRTAGSDRQDLGMIARKGGKGTLVAADSRKLR